MNEWHALSTQPVLEAVASSAEGLSQDEAVARLVRHGPNHLTPPRRRGPLLRFLLQFHNVLIYVLLASAAVTALLAHWVDTAVILGVVVINVTISVLQEVRAKRKLDHIALLTRPAGTVLRDGGEQTVDLSQVVQGDVLIVRPGDQVIADGHLIGDGQADMDESLLTGESEVVPKHVGDSLYAGSFCVHGSAVYEAERVSAQAMASQITVTARAFRRPPRSHRDRAATSTCSTIPAPPWKARARAGAPRWACCASTTRT